jgi:hypothetical protein
MGGGELQDGLAGQPPNLYAETLASLYGCRPAHTFRIQSTLDVPGTGTRRKIPWPVEMKKRE